MFCFVFARVFQCLCVFRPFRGLVELSVQCFESLNQQIFQLASLSEKQLLAQLRHLLTEQENPVKLSPSFQNKRFRSLVLFFFSCCFF